jgi:nitrite reductase/ring-hydroxylating ferredoxin subunit
MNREIEEPCMAPLEEMGSCAGMGCELSRRAFLGGTMAAVAAFLAACGDQQFGAAGNPVAPGDGTTAGGGMTVRVADYPALAPVGGIARVDTAAGTVALVHLSQGAYAAFSMRCPHQGTRVNIVGGGFVCPNHNARFNAAGQWTGGQRTSGLAPVPITYAAADGTITIGGGSVTAGTTGGTAGGTTGRGDDEEDEDDD